MAQAIVNAVSKMAAMFSTMLPAPAAADAPSLALLRHNDLQYLAGHLLVLPFLFGSELKELLGSYVWLGDDALRLRGAARSAFNDVVSLCNGCGGCRVNGGVVLLGLLSWLVVCEVAARHRLCCNVRSTSADMLSVRNTAESWVQQPLAMPQPLPGVWCCRWLHRWQFAC
jgi:hypothetical protein